MKIKEMFYVSLHLIDGLGMEFTACEGAYVQVLAPVEFAC